MDTTNDNVLYMSYLIDDDLNKVTCKLYHNFDEKQPQDATFSTAWDYSGADVIRITTGGGNGSVDAQYVHWGTYVFNSSDVTRLYNAFNDIPSAPS